MSREKDAHTIEREQQMNENLTARIQEMIAEPDTRFETPNTGECARYLQFIESPAFANAFPEQRDKAAARARVEKLRQTMAEKTMVSDPMPEFSHDVSFETNQEKTVDAVIRYYTSLVNEVQSYVHRETGLLRYDVDRILGSIDQFLNTLALRDLTTHPFQECLQKLKRDIQQKRAEEKSDQAHIKDILGTEKLQRAIQAEALKRHTEAKITEHSAQKEKIQQGLATEQGKDATDIRLRYHLGLLIRASTQELKGKKLPQSFYQRHQRSFDFINTHIDRLKTIDQPDETEATVVPLAALDRDASSKAGNAIQTFYENIRGAATIADSGSNTKLVDQIDVLTAEAHDSIENAPAEDLAKRALQEMAEAKDPFPQYKDTIKISHFFTLANKWTSGVDIRAYNIRRLVFEAKRVIQRQGGTMRTEELHTIQAWINEFDSIATAEQKSREEYLQSELIREYRDAVAAATVNEANKSREAQQAQKVAVNTRLNSIKNEHARAFLLQVVAESRLIEAAYTGEQADYEDVAKCEQSSLGPVVEARNAFYRAFNPAREVRSSALIPPPENFGMFDEQEPGIAPNSPEEAALQEAADAFQAEQVESDGAPEDEVEWLDLRDEDLEMIEDEPELSLDGTTQAALQHARRAIEGDVDAIAALERLGVSKERIAELQAAAAQHDEYDPNRLLVSDADTPPTSNKKGDTPSKGLFGRLIAATVAAYTKNQ